MEVRNLKAYLANIGMTLKDFCEIVDCDSTYMSNVNSGRRNCGHRLAKDVNQLTSGIVTLKTNPRRRDILRQQMQEQQQKQQQNQ